MAGWENSPSHDPSYRVTASRQPVEVRGRRCRRWGSGVLNRVLNLVSRTGWVVSWEQVTAREGKGRQMVRDRQMIRKPGSDVVDGVLNSNRDGQTETRKCDGRMHISRFN